MDRLGKDRRVVAAISIAYFLHGLIAIFNNWYLDSEGILVWVFASMMLHDPLAISFFLKSRPVVSALYAPFTALGFQAFLLAHLAVATALIPLTAGLSRHLGHRRPALAALIVATSTLLVAAGPAGVNNVEAATWAMVSASLIVAWNRPFLGGLALGVLPFARSEGLFFVAAMALYALSDPKLRKAIIGIAVFPTIYLLLGSIYHADLLWFLHFPPAPLQAHVDNPFAGRPGDLQGLALHLLHITPVIALAWCSPLKRMTSFEKAIAVFAPVFIIIVRGMPALGMHLDDSPRYLLLTAPFIALLVTRTATTWEEGGFGLLPPVGVLLLLAVLAARIESIPAGYAIALSFSLLAFAWLGYAKLAMAVICITCLAAPLPLMPASRLLIRDDERMERFASWIESNTSVGDPVVVNRHYVGFWMNSNGRAQGRQLELLLHDDVRAELRELSNPDNGQREALIDLITNHSDHFQAHAFFHEELDRIDDGRLLIFCDDPRLSKLLADRYADRFEEIDEDGNCRLLRVTPPTDTPRAP